MDSGSGIFQMTKKGAASGSAAPQAGANDAAAALATVSPR